MRSPPNEIRAVMGPLDPALAGIAMLLCLGLAVGKGIGEDPNTGCGKGAVLAGGGAVAGGAAISKAGLLGSKAASVGAKAASVGAKAVGVGATATVADDVARVASLSDDVARTAGPGLESVGAMSDDVARGAAADGGHGFDGASAASHSARSVGHLANASSGENLASGESAPCTHASELRGLTTGAIPGAFQGAVVQSMIPDTTAWSSEQLWKKMKAARTMDPCDPSIDALDLTPRQRAAVIDGSGNYLVLVLEGDRMLVERTDGTKLLLAPID